VFVRTYFILNSVYIAIIAGFVGVSIMEGLAGLEVKDMMNGSSRLNDNDKTIGTTLASTFAYLRFLIAFVNAVALEMYFCAVAKSPKQPKNVHQYKHLDIDA
jgi:hypothetical protein